MDLMATEPHFADHLAPVWDALSSRGRFLVPASIEAHARSLGVDPTVVAGLGAAPDAVDAAAIRTGDAPVLVASYGDVKRARAMGRRDIAFIEHGIGQSYAGDREASFNGSYAGGRDRDDVSLFLMPNSYSAARMRAAYPAADIQIVGSPKLDRLPHREPGPGPVIAFSFHWPCSACPETHPAYSHFAAALPAVARVFRTIGHAHPRYWQLAKSYSRMGIPFVERFDDVCRQADLYVCDNSSTIYEFAATGRPVVVLNSPEYRRHVRHGLRFWDAATVGIQVDEPAALLPSIEEALADPVEVRNARESALDLAYAYRTGAAARAAAALTAWATARTLVAA